MISAADAEVASDEASEISCLALRPAPSHKPVASGIAVAVMLLAFAGTGCTRVESGYAHSGSRLPRPDLIVVHDFAVAPDEVRLGQGLAARLEEMIDTQPRSQQELEVGRQVADALAAHLVTEIRDLGLPAARASGASPSGDVLAIDGQFVSVDQGNRMRRMVIGFGAGESDVIVNVQLYREAAQGQQLLDEFQVEGDSGYKPGMGPMVGAGAAAGRLVTVAATSAGLTATSEALSDTVVADADRAAKGIAKQLAVFFAQEGWIAH